MRRQGDIQLDRVRAVQQLLSGFAHGSLAAEGEHTHHVPTKLWANAYVLAELMVELQDESLELAIGRTLELLCNRTRSDDPFKQVVRGPACLFLLLRANRQQSSKADIVRLYKFRHHFGCLKWEDSEGMLSFREHLGMAVITHNFVSCEEGQRFLAYCCALHESVAEELIEVSPPSHSHKTSTWWTVL